MPEDPHAGAGHRNELRRNGRCRGRGAARNWAGGDAAGRPDFVEHDLQSAHRASPLWRRGPGNRRPCPLGADRRADRAGYGRGRCGARRSRRHRRDRRAGADRRGHGGSHDRQGAGFRPREAVPGDQPPRGPRAFRAPDRAGRVSLSAAAGVGRPLPASHRARARRLHAARHDHRRCGRRVLRQDGQAPGAGFPGRAGGREGRGRRRSPAFCPAAADVAQARL